MNIPVSITSAESRPDVQLYMVDSSNHALIRYERVNPDTGEAGIARVVARIHEYLSAMFVRDDVTILILLRNSSTK